MWTQWVLLLDLVKVVYIHIATVTTERRIDNKVRVIERIDKRNRLLPNASAQFINLWRAFFLVGLLEPSAIAVSHVSSPGP